MQPKTAERRAQEMIEGAVKRGKASEERAAAMRKRTFCLNRILGGKQTRSRR